MRTHTQPTDGENDVQARVQSQPQADDVAARIAALTDETDALALKARSTWSLTIAGGAYITGPEAIDAALNEAQAAGILPPHRPLGLVHLTYEWDTDKDSRCSPFGNGQKFATERGVKTQVWQRQDGVQRGVNVHNLARNRRLAPATDVLLVMAGYWLDAPTIDLIMRCLILGKSVYVWRSEGARQAMR